MKTPVAAVVFAVLCAAGAFVGLVHSLPSWRDVRGWWADRLQVRRARAEWKRRKLAYKAAQEALDPDDLFDRRARDQARSIDVGIAVGLALAIAAAMLLHGCGGRYPIDDGTVSPTGETDAAAENDATSHAPAGDAGAAEVHEPQCQALTSGEEFFAADTSAQLAQLYLNDQGCLKFCRNTAGGATCVSAQNTLVRCAACDSQVHP